jgi:hypothetical protein
MSRADHAGKASPDHAVGMLLINGMAKKNQPMAPMPNSMNAYTRSG